MSREDCITNVRRSDSCPTGWKIMQPNLGEGARGEAYSTCCDKSCRYVAKHFFATVNEFQNEMTIQLYASLHGLAPKIFDSWTCSHGGIIVMESVKSTLLRIFEKCILEKKSFFLYVVMKYVVEAYFQLVRLGICHSDLHFENIMIDYESDIDLYMGKFQIFFIDFGSSFLLNKKKLSLEKDMTEMKKKVPRDTKIDWKNVEEQCADGFEIYKNFEREVENFLSHNETEFLFYRYTLLMIFLSFHLRTRMEPPTIDEEILTRFSLKKNPILQETYDSKTDSENMKLYLLFETENDRIKREEHEKKEKEKEDRELQELFGEDETEDLKLLKKSHQIL